MKIQDIKENSKISGNFHERNTGPGTKLPNLYRTVLKNTGLSVEKPRRWSP